MGRLTIHPRPSPSPPSCVAVGSTNDVRAVRPRGIPARLQRALHDRGACTVLVVFRQATGAPRHTIRAGPTSRPHLLLGVFAYGLGPPRPTTRPCNIRPGRARVQEAGVREQCPYSLLPDATTESRHRFRPCRRAGSPATTPRGYARRTLGSGRGTFARLRGRN